VVARDTELETGPGAAVWAASLPEAEIETFHSVALNTDDGVAVSGFPILDGADLVTFFVDPFTFPAAGFLAKLNEEEDGAPLVGGLAAGAGEPDTQALFLDGEVLTEGAVGAVLRGVPVRTVVSQGCAPIGRDAVITNAEGNVVFELAGEPALERLKTDLGTLSDEEQQLAASGGVLAGLVIDENRSEYRRGETFHELYDVIRRSKAIVSKPGGCTLIDSLSSATPVVLLEPYGYAEQSNARIWEHLGYGISYPDWQRTGFDPAVLERLHTNILTRSPRGTNYPRAYADRLRAMPA